MNDENINFLNKFLGSYIENPSIILEQVQTYFYNNKSSDCQKLCAQMLGKKFSDINRTLHYHIDDDELKEICLKKIFPESGRNLKKDLNSDFRQQFFEELKHSECFMFDNRLSERIIYSAKNNLENSISEISIVEENSRRFENIEAKGIILRYLYIKINFKSKKSIPKKIYIYGGIIAANMDFYREYFPIPAKFKELELFKKTKELI